MGGERVLPVGAVDRPKMLTADVHLCKEAKILCSGPVSSHSTGPRLDPYCVWVVGVGEVVQPGEGQERSPSATTGRKHLHTTRGQQSSGPLVRDRSR